ncbi:HD domain-containing protein [Sporomusa malonica]|uniref:HD domain-containing protein n=1 Tax=Sporomusa malonica TaxID=112901 RepID=A0A1W1ZPL7_9FIRM|nr:HD domain-containing protein [Sporomusa malonica]SMC50048.1 HD domain-containing protein [Sporomusa malonica]
MVNLQYLYEWFQGYVQAYYTEDKFIMDRVLLKEGHSKRVAASSVSLAGYLALDARQKSIAEVIGLLHDISRFRQVTEYRTFVDADSFDHGDAGAAELTQNSILQEFTAAEQAMIGFAIINHNKMLIPPACPETELFAKIIRDADKLDIFRVLPPIQADHDYSPKLIGQLKQGGVLAYIDVKTLADKRLIRLSWFYDIYFDWTLKQLVDEGYLERQLAALPDNEDCSVIKATLKAYIAKRLAGTAII